MKKDVLVTYNKKKAINVLQEIEIILLSLHRIGSAYMHKPKEDYDKETNEFIDSWKVTKRLANIRTILSEPFDSEIGDDDMDELERAMLDLNIWEKPGDKPS